MSCSSTFTPIELFTAEDVGRRTPAQRQLHPRTGVERFYLTPGDIAAFHGRFVTLPTLASELGQHRQTIAGKLRAAEAQPFAPNGYDFGSIWLREEVEKALR